MTVYLAADHAGVPLKEELLAALAAFGHEAVDMGATQVDENDDYPDYILPCAKRVAAEPGTFGIVIGGSGHGEAMAANRVKGARAVTFYGPRALDGDGYDIVRVSRMHNDANVLSLGARFVSLEEATEAVRTFLATPFSGDERHIRRLGKF